MRKRQSRLLVFIVAYNAQKTIQEVLGRIPPGIFADYDCEILIIDDQSQDLTFERASAWKQAHPEQRLTVLCNPVNQGYGGNQKLGYRYAIAHGFDVVALLHGDGQYAPERLPELVSPVAGGEADAVFGTRMAEKGRALSGGMPVYKYVGNRVLTCVQNRLLGLGLSEYHSGYRIYSVAALAELPFGFNTNDFHFDTEIIIQFWAKGLRIREVPIPTYYGAEICHVNGIKYAWQVVRATLLARLHNMHILYQRHYDVARPQARYPLKLGYPSSHSMAIDAVPAGARVLDIGCGQGLVGRELENKACSVRGIDDAGGGGTCLLGDFARVDLSRALPEDRADAFDCILLLDIIEHLDSPAIYRLLDHIRVTAEEKKPLLVITTPNISFGLIRLQMLRGRFNYGRRGILDMTHRHLFTFQSLREVLAQSGFRVEKIRGIPPPYPEAIGDNALCRLLLWLNCLLIRLFPGFFSYQIFVCARPLPTLEHLLGLAFRAAARREKGQRGDGALSTGRESPVP